MIPAAAAAAEVSRGEGARLAREELADSAYAESEPGLLQRIWDAVQEYLAELLGRAAGGMPGGWWTLAPLLVLLVLAAVLLAVRARPGRAHRRSGDLFAGSAAMTADDHRTAAEQAAADGDHTAAVRERLRAIALDLERRAVIRPRAGRTASELAADAAAALPEHGAALGRAADVFNGAVYGGRAATADDSADFRDLDSALAAARPAQEAGADTPSGGAQRSGGWEIGR
ncbi:DUF4129 domain-containing protein [Nocardiopsis coralliicola]